jgi:hypothetical protein
MMDTEIFSALFTCVAWVAALFDLAIGVAAIVRLRTTPAGMLIGGGFVLMGMFGVLMRIVRAVITPDFGAAEVDFEAYMVQSSAVGSVSTCGAMLFMLAIGIGFLLLPKSLEILAQKKLEAATH